MSPKTGATLMRIVAGLFGLFAACWALAPFPDINLPARFILDVSDWPLDNLDAPLDQYSMWLSSISAALLAAVAVMFAFIVAPAIEQGNREVTRVAVHALLTWFVIDNVGSVAAGVSSNVVFNLVYLGLALGPIVLTRKTGE